jgi:hypothetical protein
MFFQSPRKLCRRGQGATSPDATPQVCHMTKAYVQLVCTRLGDRTQLHQV